MVNQPECVITLDGSDVPQKAIEDLISIDVVEQIGRPARARLQLRNWDPDKNETEMAEGEGGSGLAPGKSIVIKMGFGSSLSEVFTGLVVAMHSRFDPSQVPVLEVDCRCDGIRLTGVQRTQVWTEKPDFAAVQDLCGNAGLSATGSSGDPSPVLLQYRATDWEYLTDRAGVLGFPLYCRTGRLQFQKPNASGSPVAKLAWGEDLLSLELSEDLRRAVHSASARAWDPEQKDVVQAQTAASESNFSAGSRASSDSLLSNANLTAAWTLDLGDSTPLPQSELQSWTQSVVDQRSLSAYHGSGECEGNSAIRIDSLIGISGVGPTYDGNYYVTLTRHRFKPSDYATSFELGAPPAPRRDGSEEERSIPRVRGPVLAKVTNNTDSDKNQGRVQITFPWMGDNTQPIWARLSSAAAGGSRGFVFIPEPDDEVLVVFLEGDPRYPLVIGTLWNGVDAPPDPYDAEKNARRAIVSKSGHKLVFDDGDDAPQVFVESAAGQQILIDDTSGSEQIELKDKTGNTVTLDSSGISLTAASGVGVTITASSGSVEISGQSVSISSQSQTEVSGSATTVSGDASLSMSGGTVSVNGDATVSASAPMITLN